MKQKGFTLIELLVVIAIIGILVAIGVISFGGFQKRAKVNACKQNNKTICNYVRAEVHKCYLGEEYILKGNYKCSKMYEPNANVSGDIANAIITALQNDFKNPYGNVNPNNGDVGVMYAWSGGDKDLGYTSIQYYGGNINPTIPIRTCTELPCKVNWDANPVPASTVFCDIKIDM